MRHYPSNSVQAAGRLIALALLADGGLDASELAALERSSVLERLGISAAAFQQVLLALCDDAMQYGDWPGMQQIAGDPAVLDQLLDEVTDPDMQLALLRAMLDVVDADRYLSGGERTLITRAMLCWYDRLLSDMPPLARITRVHTAHVN